MAGGEDRAVILASPSGNAEEPIGNPGISRAEGQTGEGGLVVSLRREKEEV